MNKITLEEKHKIQLAMVEEIDEFCNKHNIRYSLAFGTLIGAIRHHGFIPWDDDLDIMMPVKDMLKFKKLFKSKNLRYIDADSNLNFNYSFSRIYNSKTYSKLGLFNKDIGINIDLYPIINIPKTKEQADLFFKRAMYLESYRELFIKWNSRIIRRFPIKRIPFYKYFTHLEHEYFINDNTCSETGIYFIVCMSLSKRNRVIFDTNLFSQTIDVEFEGHLFKAIKKYDIFLTQMYGDYMKLPPIEERVPYHGGEYYWER